MSFFEDLFLGDVLSSSYHKGGGLQIFWSIHSGESPIIIKNPLLINAIRWVMILNLRLERTRLHPSTSSSTLRQFETETKHRRPLQRETSPMLNGDVASPISTVTTTTRWTSGNNSPQFYFAILTFWSKVVSPSLLPGCRMMGQSHHWSRTGCSSRKKPSSL